HRHDLPPPPPPPAGRAYQVTPPGDRIRGERPMAAQHHHVTPVWQYVLVFVLLLVGTILTVVASLYDMGWANTPVALTIAIFKAMLVLLVFMELRHSTRMTVLTAAAGFFWLFLMIGLFLMDYGTRMAVFLPVPGK